MLGGLSPRQFLREHWQKKPLLVRGAFPRFRDPITPEELAGLACEEGVESRIVRERSRRRWDVVWGPHPEAQFEAMPATKWTLLVQEVNRWVPAAALLLERFSFLPNVRVDDVMVSYAAPGGSVGPHLDSYDVFLVQGLGRRRWQYHEQTTRDRAFVEGLDLRILERFEPEADATLEAGDMLYLPPGFAHHGIAVTPCLTYSIGFRAMNVAEAWTSFATYQGARIAPTLLRDPPLLPLENPGEIPPKLLAEVRRAVKAMDRSDEAIDRWFASFATRLKPGHAIEPPRREPRDVLQRIARGDEVVRSEEARWAFLPSRRGVRLYVGGEEIDVASAAAPLAKTLCASRRHFALALPNAASKALVLDLFRRGALTFGRVRAAVLRDR
jgi:50S ribosomal protein L16 3-hydroxylase